MSDRWRQPHYVRALKTTKTPRVCFAWDVETVAKGRGRTRLHTFQLAHLYAWERLGDHRTEVLHDATYTDPARFWERVLALAGEHKRVVGWCHGLAYDLRASRALVVLPELGAELDSIALARQTSWCAWKGPVNPWQLVDLYSWVPHPLAQIQRMMGRPVSPALAVASDLPARRERCRADALAVAEAAEQLMGWIDTEGLGTFRPTGAGASHSAWRRRFMPHPPKVHGQEDVTELERRAMWTGRCEAWRWGVVPAMPATEYDLQTAYAHIAKDCDLPLRLEGALRRPQTALGRAERYEGGILADVTVRTAVEALPGPLQDRTVWPVGEFRTVLWDPELRLALQECEDITVHRAWLYATAPVLSDALSWILALLDAPASEVTPLVRAVAKHWSRALVGRVALRYSQWSDYGRHPRADARLAAYGERETGEVSQLLHVGHRLMIRERLAEAEDSLPQLTGWVMSEARRRLWELMRLAGLEQVLYVDTDALIVRQQGARNLQAAIKAGGAYSLARKYTIRRLEVAGPRLLWVDDERRLAGVPRTAREGTHWRYEASLWRSLPESLARGEPDRIRISDTSIELDYHDGRREQIDGGITRPLQMEDAHVCT